MKIEAIEELKVKGEIGSDDGEKFLCTSLAFLNERSSMEFWTMQEKKSFREGVIKYGKNWGKVAAALQSKDVK